MYLQNNCAALALRLRTLFPSLIIVLFLFSSLSRSQLQPFIKGGDLSFLPQIEANGGNFKDSGLIKDAFQIFKDNGFNYVRVRIWHTPNNGVNNLANTLSLASRIKQHSLKFLLDIHYSDWWADPGHQTKPAAWASISVPALKESVYQYTSSIMVALTAQGTPPDMVQIGNEITCGMLWYDCNICGGNDNPEHWSNLGDVLKEGIRGIKDNELPGDSVQIMIHTDRSTNNGSCRWFFNNILEQNVPFDIIGLSYYPWWHGTFNQLSSNMNDLATRYNKNILVVETAYPWTLEWWDSENNIVGDSDGLLTGYPATKQGQENFLRDLITTIKIVPDNKGIGVMYWAPDWISSPAFTSAWENLAMFDFQGNALGSFQAFESNIFYRAVPAGWNLVSLPSLSFNMQKAENYPQAISSAFSYTSEGYITEDTLQPGRGYWLKFPAQQEINFNGDSITEMSVNVVSGWNLIGSPSFPVAVSDIGEEPSGNIISETYSYRNGYNVTDSLRPGEGYWIKVNQPGLLIFTNTVELR